MAMRTDKTRKSPPKRTGQTADPSNDEGYKKLFAETSAFGARERARAKTVKPTAAAITVAMKRAGVRVLQGPHDGSPEDLVSRIFRAMAAKAPVKRATTK